jgi:dienelactone hydrolase
MLTAIGACVAPCAQAGAHGAADGALETIRVQLPSGAAEVDVYWPDTGARAPLVIIAHGFSRDRHEMSGWGRHLAEEGFVAVVPDLPTRSDHSRNGRFLSELREHFIGGGPWSTRIDSARVGLLGFSAGGLSSLLAAADSPGVTIWVGLDPVDRDRLGANAAPKVQAATVVLTAEPSTCNAQGNARDIIAGLSRPEHFSFPGAVHVDAEWPTSWLAELVCGRSSEEGRRQFRVRATSALRKALLPADSMGARPGLQSEH